MPVEGQIVFVGSRSAAFEAARALGYEPVLVEPYLPTSVEGREVELRRAAEDIISGLDRPIAVVSAIERGVALAGALRDAWDLPGHSLEVAQRTTDKALMKDRLLEVGIRCAASKRIDATTDPSDLLERFGLPVVVKPRALSGSRGTTLCRTKEELEAACVPDMLAEELIQGREMSMESWVVGGEVVWTNPTRYLQPGWANVVPAGISRRDRDQLEELNQRVVTALGVERGITHLEVFWTDAGLVVGELATRPPGGDIMPLMGEAYPEFDPWKAWIVSEVTGTFDPPGEAVRAAGVWFIHPGPGVVREVIGVDEANAIEGVSATIRVKPGETTGTREGVGQTVGKIRAVGETPDEVAHGLTRARKLVDVALEPAEG